MLIEVKTIGAYSKVEEPSYGSSTIFHRAGADYYQDKQWKTLMVECQ